ncbi:MAG TPA: cell division protein FtsA [Bryobacteraceae bacterium]|nr:cell division protein FtsA [Bryobacteraceae bacterium]
MRHSKDNSTSALGLDVGTSRVCLAQRVGEDFQYETQLNAFVTIPYSKMTENVLRKEKVPHTVNGAEMVVHGNESDRFADLLNIETRRTMDRGVLNPAEPDSLSMLRKIIETLVDPTKEKQKLCFTVPAAPLGAEENLTYHEATLRQILSEFGYEVKSINEGLAVIYSELESTNYTGIGISCGGGLCNVSVAYLSVPVFSFSIPKAGDYIDHNTASVTGERANRVRIAKEESFHFNGFFADKMHQVLGVYYEEMIQALVNGMKQAFTNARNIPKSGRALPIVLSGGTALPEGFRDRFEKILKEAELPIAATDIRMAADPLHSSAKGALVAALADL